jgi:hypothetical protein
MVPCQSPVMFCAGSRQPARRIASPHAQSVFRFSLHGSFVNSSLNREIAVIGDLRTDYRKLHRMVSNSEFRKRALNLP